jgi:3-phosphoshikimate 1-carboxyvinyltransferase
MQRPHEELFLQLNAKAESESVVIPVAGSLPQKISLERSSQFASAFLIAGAAKVFRGEMPEYVLRFEGERRSESYVQMTLKHIAATGLKVEENATEIRISTAVTQKRLRAVISRDASALAFFEVLAQRWGISSFFTEENLGAQGDAIFPKFLDALVSGESKISLRHYPDLAPPLWAAAALLRCELQVLDCPQLRLKESDRALLLVQAAVTMGAEAELGEGGFRVDFRHFKAPNRELYLCTDGDHRLAMAFALVGLEYRVVPDRRDCVRKSFPEFWQALKLFVEALPG